MQIDPKPIGEPQSHLRLSQVDDRGASAAAEVNVQGTVMVHHDTNFHCGQCTVHWVGGQAQGKDNHAGLDNPGVVHCTACMGTVGGEIQLVCTAEV